MSLISTQDREEIHGLIARYSHSVDAGHVDAWVDLFTADGEIISPSPGNAKGREELRAWVERALGLFSGYQIRHIVTNTLLLPASPDVVHARSYVLLTRQAEEASEPSAMPGTEVMATGVYVDEIHRTPRGWKFRSRTAGSALPLDPAFLADRPSGSAAR